MKKPIIGITLDYIDDGDSSKYSDFPWYALRQHYSNIVLKNGGIPIFLPFESYKEDLTDVIELIDGLIIPGGDMDVPPAMYNEEILFNTKPAIERCNIESDLILEVLERDMPFLGICHGMQLLNVLLGGSMYQDIKEQIPNAINHKQPMSRLKTYHNIKIEEGTLLAEIVVNQKEFAINSNHRQAINRLGKGLIVSALCCDDGVIEAIESLDHEFVLGLEWHPEIEASREQDNAIIYNFIEAAREYSGKISKSDK